jgi:VanZ family protein
MVAAVIVLAVSPEVPSVLDVPGSDTLDHVLAYLTLMFWFCQLYSEPRRRLWLGAGLFALGVCLELVQGLLVFRTAALADALANGGGILVGWGLAKTRLGNLLPYLDGRLLRLMSKSWQ